MSYDLRIAVKVVGAEAGSEYEYAVIAVPERDSPTYNLGTMFRKCSGWDFKQGEYYNVAEVYPKIERGIANLTERETEFKQYDAPNGWGTTETALLALQSLKDCIDEISDPNGFTGYKSFPKKLLYVAW